MLHGMTEISAASDAWAVVAAETPLWFWLTAFGALGAILGSLVNAAAYRLPRGISMITRSHSFCPQENSVTDYELAGKATLASFGFGFRPRFCGPSVRFKMFSRLAKNAGEPHGRPVLVWQRRNSICATSSVPSQACQSVTTPRGGKSAAKSGALRRPQWAAALDLRIRFRTRHHPGANRIAFDITDCRPKVFSIQWRGAETVLPQMPTLPPPVVYPQAKRVCVPRKHRANDSSCCGTATTCT
jgi:hypothetical protein